MSKVPLFDEYRLIERSETEINGVWKGAHLLLFFLAFVFGSFCTFCFHMLMYLFDEKCVLFPKLLSLTSMRHNVIYEFIPSAKDLANMPVDFLSTQWVEKSTCSLPTYVPLVSGIFGLVWTTMFLMCSTGSRTLTGLQRPWRVLPPVFVFSLAMGSLCVYSSTITHYGLQELCLKLGEITGSATCTYTVNVATLTYERRIRGVYQATRLTILSAWLHTACWLLSALLALVRVLMAVDFQLVRVHVRLHGDIDKILEKNEVQIRTVSPEIWINEELECISLIDLTMQAPKMHSDAEEPPDSKKHIKSPQLNVNSENSLLPEEKARITKKEAYKADPKDKAFISKLVYDTLDAMPIPGEKPIVSSSLDIGRITLPRQYAQEKIISEDNLIRNAPTRELSADDVEIARDLKKVDSLIIHGFRRKHKTSDHDESKPSTSRAAEAESHLPVVHLAPKTKHVEDTAGTSKAYKERKEDKEIKPKKSNLKTVGVQTKTKKKERLHVQITDQNFISRSDSDDEQTTTEKKEDVDKETQTRGKEKQD